MMLLATQIVISPDLSPWDISVFLIVFILSAAVSGIAAFCLTTWLLEFLFGKH